MQSLTRPFVILFILFIRTIPLCLFTVSPGFPGVQETMRGWIILNGLVSIGGLSAIAAGITSSIGIKSLSVLALVLLTLTLATKTIRGRV